MAYCTFSNSALWFHPSTATSQETLLKPLLNLRLWIMPEPPNPLHPPEPPDPPDPPDLSQSPSTSLFPCISLLSPLSSASFLSLSEISCSPSSSTVVCPAGQPCVSGDVLLHRSAKRDSKTMEMGPSLSSSLVGLVSSVLFVGLFLSPIDSNLVVCLTKASFGNLPGVSTDVPSSAMERPSSVMERPSSAMERSFSHISSFLEKSCPSSFSFEKRPISSILSDMESVSKSSALMAFRAQVVHSPLLATEPASSSDILQDRVLTIDFKPIILEAPAMEFPIIFHGSNLLSFRFQALFSIVSHFQALDKTSLWQRVSNFVCLL
ncbi:unnamed protein product [Arabidopsis lyrata]|uniref:Expressed protein n=1 Tax=Arabidopsis lyrata subsp. lyrata TaxID=81972 RepID=D7LRS0_ARALL|nr:expressed protein [Arabidopsis lyrata subsp. lyrata]CAH8269293.1 unnamed protein product [Arabidopsis lyrata]